MNLFKIICEIEARVIEASIGIESYETDLSEIFLSVLHLASRVSIELFDFFEDEIDIIRRRGELLAKMRFYDRYVGISCGDILEFGKREFFSSIDAAADIFTKRYRSRKFCIDPVCEASEPLF